MILVRYILLNLQVKCDNERGPSSFMDSTPTRTVQNIRFDLSFANHKLFDYIFLFVRYQQIQKSIIFQKIFLRKPIRFYSEFNSFSILAALTTTAPNHYVPVVRASKWLIFFYSLAYTSGDGMSLPSSPHPLMISQSQKFYQNNFQA